MRRAPLRRSRAGTRRGRCRAGRRARGRRPGSRARPRSSARGSICPSSSDITYGALAVQDAGRFRPTERRTVASRLEMPSPPGSTPTMLTLLRRPRRDGRGPSRSSRRPRTRRATSGSRPSSLAGSARRVSSPITRWKSRTMSRIGVRAHHRADAVVGVADVRDPVAQRLVDRVLERARAARHGVHLGAEQLHAEDVQRLAPHVLLAHVDLALEPQQRAGGGGRRPVLARTGLRDHARLAHVLGEQAWPSTLLILCAPVCARSSRFR